MAEIKLWKKPYPWLIIAETENGWWFHEVNGAKSLSRAKKRWYPKKTWTIVEAMEDWGN